MKKLTGKDILAIVLCLVIYVALVFVSEFTDYISPLLWVGVSVIAAFFGAFPMTYLMARVQKPLIALGTAVLWAVFMLASGEVWNPIIVIFPLVAGVIAEALHKAPGYNTFKGLRVSYAVLALVPFSQMLSLWTNTDTYVTMAVAEMGTEAYGTALRSYANAGGLVLAVILTLAVGYASTYLAVAALKKPIAKYDLK